MLFGTQNFIYDGLSTAPLLHTPSCPSKNKISRLSLVQRSVIHLLSLRTRVYDNDKTMVVKLAFPTLSSEYPDVDMLRSKEVNYFATECILPRRPKRSLPPLPEDKECSNTELKKTCKMVLRRRKHRKQCLKLPALPEHDEC